MWTYFMKKADLKHISNNFHESDDPDFIYELIKDKNEKSLYSSALTIALKSAFERVKKVEELNENSFLTLNNKEKYFLLRGAIPTQEYELKTFILDQYYRFTN
ncbi:hypothetical protein C9J20_19620 [Photobacterium phosphoreum]|nr:hypothetical protein C9J20_19620 [Photobacterium phosphoreum]